MKIDKSKLKTLWYEDEQGNEIPMDGDNWETPLNATYQVSRFPLEVNTTHLKLIKQKDVDACKHKRKWIKRTGGWVDGIKGRECQMCHGTQVKKWWQPWGFKWDGSGGSRVSFTETVHIGGDGKLLVAMVNSGDYTLEEAMIVYSMACERCANVLWHKYLPGIDGYAEYSEEWEKCGTSCAFCEQDNF